jgi:hypothetical protein
LASTKRTFPAIHACPIPDVSRGGRLSSIPVRRWCSNIKGSPPIGGLRRGPSGQLGWKGRKADLTSCGAHAVPLSAKGEQRSSRQAPESGHDRTRPEWKFRSAPSNGWFAPSTAAQVIALLGRRPCRSMQVAGRLGASIPSRNADRAAASSALRFGRGSVGIEGRQEALAPHTFVYLPANEMPAGSQRQWNGGRPDIPST